MNPEESDHLCKSPYAMFVIEKDVHDTTSFDSQGFSWDHKGIETILVLIQFIQ